MTELPFTAEDSWALWNLPNASLDDKTDKEREELFANNYQPETFPIELLPDDLEKHLKGVQYVLVGMNPGNAGNDHPAEGVFLNFHGQKKSADSRLAAAVYGTAVWGTFMTDLSNTIDSDSTRIKFIEANVAQLEAHLDELGIPRDATLIAMGKKTATALDQFATRPVAQIPHYSRANAHWNATDAHALLLSIGQK
ncbi:hypothetical protein ACFQH1_05765 [Lactiplantibacillus daoliensis]|uniref:Uracil-DNA glycosylase n=1 Tax=Lactiplantibacillus daoliensis TaxID=2559916 RepID=A0ABW1UF36_9LACO|nr:hypothetical protein [Lactiplantibacillus daoliensis]